MAGRWRMPGPRLLGNAAAAGSTLSWAVAFPLTEGLLASWDPLALAAVRIAGAGAILLLLALALGHRRELRWAPWPKVLRVGGIGIGLGALGLVLGQRWSDPLTAAVIATTSPALAVLFLWWSEGERPRAVILVGVVLSVAGALLASLRPFGAVPGFRGGEVLVLASMVLWVWYSRACVVELEGLSDVTRGALATLAGGLVLLLALGLWSLTGIAPPRVDWSAGSALLVVLLALAIAGAAGLWTPAVRLLGVTVASMHLNLTPLYVILLGLPFGLRPTPGQVVGALLVVAGTTLAQWPQPPRTPARRTPPGSSATASSSPRARLRL